MASIPTHAVAPPHAWSSEVFEHASWGIVVGAADGTKIEALNPAFAAMHGYTVEVASGLSIAELFAPECRHGLAAEIALADDKGHHVWTSRHVRKDGSTFPVLIDATAVKDDAGIVLRRIVHVQDTTVRTRVEDALRESEERYRVLVSDLQVGVLIQGPSAEIVLSNAKALELLGLTEAQLLGTSSFDPTWNVIHEDGSPFPGPSHPVPQAIATRAPVRGIVMGVHRPTTQDRVWLQVDAMPTLHPDGSVRQVVCTFADITARRRAEEDLRSSEAMLRGFSDTNPLPMFAKDREGRWLFANPAVIEALRASGAADVDVLGKIDLEIQADTRLAASLMTVDRRVMESGEAESFEQLVPGDGGARLFLASKAPLRDGTGRVIGVVGSAQDITELRRAQDAQAKLELRLHQAERLESIGRLAGGVAHDFNNMLGVILGHTEMLIECVDPSLPLHEDLGEIRKAASRSADLTRQLLAFARKQTAVPRVLALNHTVAGMMKMLQRLIGENVRLEIVPGADLWPVHVDPSQIDQILASLCTNARDAISGTGTLRIETGNCTYDEASSASLPDGVPGEYVRLAVTDDGCGMDGETLAHIFEPFFTGKAIGKATGLGLATVHGIVKQNGGFVAVRSTPGEGTTFAIHLPRHGDKPSSMRGSRAAPFAAPGQETILLVEDEPSVLKLVTRVLEHSGYHVIQASTPGEAIRLARERRGEIQLLLTDLVMPDMNGQELSSVLSAFCPNLKHVFMSGYTADIIAEQGIVRDAADFIQKPFSPPDLVAKVRDVLDRKPPS